MRSPMIKIISAALLAAASLAAGAQTLLTQIPLGSFSGSGSSVDVAVNSATNRIYVPLEFYDYSKQYPYPIAYHSFRVLVVNGATNEIVHRLSNFPAGSFYQGIAIDPVRNFTYVLMQGAPGNVFQCEVSVVDGQTEETVKTIQLPTAVNGDCGRIAVDPVTGKVYIRASKFTENELDVIESEASGTVDTFPLPPSIQYTGMVAISPYAHRLYFNYDSDFSVENLALFDTAVDQVIKSVKLPSTFTFTDFGLSNLVVNRETGNLFGVSDSNDLLVFSSSGRLLATTTILHATGQDTTDVVGLDVDPKTNLAFAFAVTYGSDCSGTALYVIDGVTNTILSNATAAHPGGSGHYGGSVAVNPDTRRVYVPYSISPSGIYHVDGNFYLNVYSEQ
jgi:DNA-binding beta-propeller fold protein YncE